MLALLATCSLSSTTSISDSRMLLNISDVSWDAEKFGEVLGAIWKMSILICLILMIVDAIQRFGGKKLGVMHSVRFIWFIYGTAAVWRVGAHIANSYRVFNGKIFSQFYEEIFDGYFGSSQVTFFNQTITANGVVLGELDQKRLMENALFFELLIFIILRLAALGTSKGLAIGHPLSNLIGSMRRIVGFFLALFNSAHAFIWYDTVKRYTERTDNIDNRNTFNVWLSYILAIYVNIEAIWSTVEIIIHVFSSAQPIAKENYSGVSNRERDGN